MKAWLSPANLALILLFIILLGVSAMVAYWEFYPYKVLTINSLAAQVTPTNRLMVTIDYCKNTAYADMRGSIQYSLVDSVIYNLPGRTTGPLAPGCHVATEMLFIPAVPSGQYKLHMEREYDVNPLRRITVRSQSAAFPVQTGGSQVGAIVNQLMKDNQELIRQNTTLVHQNENLLTALRSLLKGQSTSPK